MAKHYFTLLLLAAGPVAAQTTPTPPPLAATPVPADTLRRPPFRGEWPDSLALAPVPAGTWQLQGQEQPRRPFLTLQDQLRTVAGVQVTPYDGSPGSGNVVRIRGASVAQGLAQPLYVVDGLPALNDDPTPGQALGVLPISTNNGTGQNYQPTVAEQNAETGASPLQLLPPEAIESIEVLTGPAAVARYGPLGANGVISIRTRRGQAGRPLRVRYSAYAGVQQVRHPYSLLGASEYATVANEAVARNSNGTSPPPYPSTSLGAGTDWQAETYRLAGLQQHQVSLDGGHAGTTYLLSADYRQQSGVLRGSDLTRLGLRLALGQQIGRHLTLQGTATLGQTDQRLPNTITGAGATRAALLAPPTQPVRDSQGAYNGYGQFNSLSQPVTSFNNPLVTTKYAYRTPKTRRVLSQLAATYTPVTNLTVEAAANFQRTLLEADNQVPLTTVVNSQLQAPSSSYSSATQTYRTSQWAARLAVRYHRQLGQRHTVGAEIDYQYQGATIFARADYRSYPSTGIFLGGGYYEQTAEFRLHRPWAALHYTFDSTLTVQAGLSYGHYRGADHTEYYPNAQLSWQAHPGHLALGLWLGAARTSTLGMGNTLFGPARLVSQSSSLGYYPEARYQSPLYTNQAEAGLRLGSHGGVFTGQLVAYQRTSYHVLLMQTFTIAQSTGFGTVTAYDEATVRNQGLELTLVATWRRGSLQGTTRLTGSLNRNRLREADGSSPLSPVFANQPVGTFYGFQQDGLNADGSRRFVQASTGASSYFPVQAVLGSGIPAQLASLSQQLRLGRLALDAQVDGLFGYQVLNQQLDLLDTPTGTTNSATTANDRWTPTHQNTSIPAAGGRLYDPSVPNFSSNYPTSNRLLENGANVRLSSLTLTYRLRQTATQDISLWVGGQNLFVLTSYRGYDPNVSSGGATATSAGIDYGAVPVPRTWLLGVKAEF